jgi:tetratricopeptide (TPR) repeat protein/TolB-like protein
MGASVPSVSAGFGVTGARTRELALLTLFGNRYEILELLGEGGMGRVYKARDRELDKVIALKTIRSEKGEDPEIVQRFKQELLLARKITHKNVIRIHDLGEAEGIKFFTMECIEGQSLKQLIRSRGRIPVDETVAIARQILGALEEAHRQGVIHRDLKPQNIMIDQASVPMVMDFGIARSADTTGMTATGAVVGTPDYMAPEQVRGEKADTQSDLFSFGVILYEMLTGDLPYQADTPVSRIMMRLSKKPIAPRELKADIPKYLEAVALKCMEIDRALRYRSAAEILQDLDRSHVDRSLTLRMQRAVAGRWTTGTAALLIAAAVAVPVYWAVRTRPAVGADGPLTTLAILPFTNATGSAELDWMRTGIPEMLVTDIAQSRYVRPVPGERVAKVLRELGVLGQTRFDEASLESVSKRAPAQSVLSGQFVESGGRLRLDLTLRRGGSGVSVPLKAEGGTATVFALVDQITGLVKEQLDLTPAQIRGDTDRPIAEVSTGSLDALRAYQAGVAKMQQGANQAAVPLLLDATSRDAGFAMAYAKLAEAYMNMGEGREAGAAADRARTLSEKAPLPLVERYQIHAIAALVKEDGETAVRSYGELAKLYPLDPDIRFNVARVYEEIGKLPEAIEAYTQVLQTAPGYGAALLGLARAQLFSGLSKEAVGSAQQALDSGQFKDDLESESLLHSIMGVAFRDTGELDKSFEHLGACLDLRRRSGDKRGQASALSNLATVYELRGQNVKALEAHQKALALAREMGDRERESNYLVETGLTHKRDGNLDKALGAFRESLQIEMGRQDSANLANRLDHVADIYRLKGQYDDALVYLDQARTQLAKSEEKTEKGINFNNTGLVQKAQGRYNEALQSLLAALPLFQEIQHETGMAEIHVNLADIYSSQGRYGDAFEALQQSLEIYKKLQSEHGIVEVKAPLGRLLVALGQLDDAEKALGEAERGSAAQATGGHGHGGHGAGDGAIAKILLGRAELAALRGRRDEAARLWEQANVKANLRGEKELAVQSRVELGLVYLEQGKLPQAEKLLLRTRQEAAQSRLRPLESLAAAALARVHVAERDPEAARKAALDAISAAEAFSGRPVLYQAQASLGESLEMLGRNAEAADAYASAAATLEWIRGGLLPEHSGPYMARADVQDFLRRTLPKLEKAGRTAEAAPLKKWLGTAPAQGRTAS